MHHTIIIAGGQGTRLWPVSKPGEPKQLLPLLPDGRSLLALAIERCTSIVPDETCRWICTAQDSVSAITEQVGFAESQIIGEPEPRDTLNAVGFAAGVVSLADPEATIAILTADHVIEPVDEFRSIIHRGFEAADRHPDALITFNIVPNRPATEYGYIRRGDALAGLNDVFEVGAYVEKPDRETAKQYLETGDYGWSSGMFVYRAQAILDAIRRLQPETYKGLQTILEAWKTNSRNDTLRRVYPTLPRTSVDYGIMEPASRDATIPVYTIPMAIDWLDVGSFTSLAQLFEIDNQGNRLTGEDIELLDSRECIVMSRDSARTTALVGCDDLIVIQTSDATLVCSKSHEQMIRDLVKRRQRLKPGRRTR